MLINYITHSLVIKRFSYCDLLTHNNDTVSYKVDRENK